MGCIDGPEVNNIYKVFLFNSLRVLEEDFEVLALSTVKNDLGFCGMKFVKFGRVKLIH